MLTARPELRQDTAPRVAKAGRMSKLKEMLSRGEAALGCFVGIPAPGLV